jgi:hypothetical protein
MRAILALAMLVALAGAAFAEDPVTERARATYKFDAWPGRAEAPRDGIDLRAIERLPGVVSKRVRYAALPDGPVATAAFETGAHLRVWIEEDVRSAHEQLLHCLARSAGPLAPLTGVAARGDIGFGAADGEHEVLAFSKANVTVWISAPAGGAAQAVAAAVESLVRESAVLGDTRARTVIAVESVEVVFGSVYPRVVTVTRGDVLWRDARATAGAFIYDGSGQCFVRADRPGTYTVTVHLLSTRGWRTTARTDVRVE